MSIGVRIHVINPCCVCKNCWWGIIAMWLVGKYFYQNCCCLSLLYLKWVRSSFLASCASLSLLRCAPAFTADLAPSPHFQDQTASLHLSWPEFSRGNNLCWQRHISWLQEHMLLARFNPQAPTEWFYPWLLIALFKLHPKFLRLDSLFLSQYSRPCMTWPCGHFTLPWVSQVAPLYKKHGICRKGD